MSRNLFLCLALLVGSASAWGGWGNWWFKNKQTECESYENKHWGWFFKEAMSAMNTQMLLNDIKAFDTNNDGFITLAERLDVNTFRRVFPNQDIVTGISRCQYVQDFTKRYSMNRDVVSTIFDYVDVDGNLLVDVNDPVEFQRVDTDGDGRIPICDAFRFFMKLIDTAERRVYLRDLKYTNLVNKYRKPWYHWFWW